MGDLYRQKRWEDLNSSESDRLPFDQIELSSEERKALMKIKETPCKSDEIDEAIQHRLLYHHFILSCYEGRLCIKDRGRDYVAYLEARHTRSVEEWIRYLITTAIAIAAFLKSFFF